MASVMTGQGSARHIGVDVDRHRDASAAWKPTSGCQAIEQALRGTARGALDQRMPAMLVFEEGDSGRIGAEQHSPVQHRSQSRTMLLGHQLHLGLGWTGPQDADESGIGWIAIFLAQLEFGIDE